MVEPKASSQIRRKLMQEAAKSSRPAIRTGTIERLIEACDVIENGTPEELIQECFGNKSGLARNRPINPSTIERVVVTKRAMGLSEWTGPKRVTIQNDQDLKSYVEARENERVKSDLPKNASSRRLRLQEAIDSIPDSMQRDLIRGELAGLHHVRNENDVLTHILKTLDPVKYEAFRDGNTHPSVSVNVTSNDEEVPKNSRKHIRDLLSRLTNNEELLAIGLELYQGRVRHKKTGRQLITKDELLVLNTLADQLD